ncbi:hypothetical protein BF304_004104 [Escherichia coli]|nr:hypothetical protein [Escherichia coli]
MKKRFSDEQIISILREAEAGVADRGENIQVWIEPVVFNDLLKWLNALDEKYALRVTQIDVSAAEKPGMVNVQRLEFGRG